MKSEAIVGMILSMVLIGVSTQINCVLRLNWARAQIRKQFVGYPRFREGLL